MAQEQIHLVPTGNLTSTAFGYEINFAGRYRKDSGVLYRFGHNAFGVPVALKVADRVEVAGPRLRREVDVAECLGRRGGELISKCLAYEFTDDSARILVALHGRPLVDIVGDQRQWPPADGIRRKMIIDLLQALEIMRLSGLVHGTIDLRNLHWDNTTLQLTEFGTAGLRGSYPDGSPAHHGDDVQAAGRVIYRLLTGEPPPEDPVALRTSIEHVQDAGLGALLLRRDLVTRADLDYVFAGDPVARPTARVLLDRLDDAPHGVQWRQLADREAAVRADFRRLRDAQRRFRADYQDWQTARSRIGTRTAEAPAPWTMPPRPATAARRHPPGRAPVGNPTYRGGPAEGQPTFTTRTAPAPAPPKVPTQPVPPRYGTVDGARVPRPPAPRRRRPRSRTPVLLATVVAVVATVAIFALLGLMT